MSILVVTNKACLYLQKLLVFWKGPIKSVLPENNIGFIIDFYHLITHWQSKRHPFFVVAAAYFLRNFLSTLWMNSKGIFKKQFGKNVRILARVRDFSSCRANLLFFPFSYVQWRSRPIFLRTVWGRGPWCCLFLAAS